MQSLILDVKLDSNMDGQDLGHVTRRLGFLTSSYIRCARQDGWELLEISDGEDQA